MSGTQDFRSMAKQEKESLNTLISQLDRMLGGSPLAWMDGYMASHILIENKNDLLQFMDSLMSRVEMTAYKEGTNSAMVLLRESLRIPALKLTSFNETAGADETEPLKLTINAVIAETETLRLPGAGVTAEKKIIHSERNVEGFECKAMHIFLRVTPDRESN